MNVKSVETEKGSAKIVVEIEKPEFENALNKAYTKCRKNIMIPGFRKGKAPRKMVEAMYGATVFYEDAVNEIFPEIYAKAVVEQKIKAVGAPSVADMDTDENGNVILTVSTELYPEVTLGEYKGIEVPQNRLFPSPRRRSMRRSHRWRSAMPASRPSSVRPRKATPL